MMPKLAARAREVAVDLSALECAMIGAVKLALFNLAVWHHLGRIEHAEPDACSKQSDKRSVDGALGKIALLHRLHIRLVIVIVGNLARAINAFVVHAA